MKCNRRALRGLLAGMLVSAVGPLASAQMPSQSMSPLNYLGRAWGFGISDGYNECQHCAQNAIDQSRITRDLRMHGQPSFGQPSPSLLKPFGAATCSSGCGTPGCTTCGSSAHAGMLGHGYSNVYPGPSLPWSGGPHPTTHAGMQYYEGAPPAHQYPMPPVPAARQTVPTPASRTNAQPSHLSPVPTYNPAGRHNPSELPNTRAYPQPEATRGTPYDDQRLETLRSNRLRDRDESSGSMDDDSDVGEMVPADRAQSFEDDLLQDGPTSERQKRSTTPPQQRPQRSVDEPTPWNYEEDRSASPSDRSRTSEGLDDPFYGDSPDDLLLPSQSNEAIDTPPAKAKPERRQDKSRSQSDDDDLIPADDLIPMTRNMRPDARYRSAETAYRTVTTRLPSSRRDDSIQNERRRELDYDREFAYRYEDRRNPLSRSNYPGEREALQSDLDYVNQEYYTYPNYTGHSPQNTPPRMRVIRNRYVQP